MATDALKRIRTEVLELPEAERAELAHDLIASLDEPAEDGAREAWDREILRRLSQVDSGQAKLLDQDSFLQKMRARIQEQ